MYKNILLSDESDISELDFQERTLLINELSLLPEQFLSTLRHFQPQIGCLNSCKMCSQSASSAIEYWSIRRLRNVVASIKYLAQKFRKEVPFIVWDRENHRNGVVFPYLDNDIGCYFYLDQFISLLYKELGVKTRISSVGYSRYNTFLNNVHSKINLAENLLTLGGVRISFTPYGQGWMRDNIHYSREDYIKDIANFMEIYRPYYNKYGSGYQRFCVELRYKPLVVISPVYESEIEHHRILCTQNYMFLSVDLDVSFVIARISNLYNHRIELSTEPIYFYQVDLEQIPCDCTDVENIARKFLVKNLRTNSIVKVYMMENHDGLYYAINPSLTDDGNYGINIYPLTQNRIKSGYIITERFFLNALFQYKKKQHLCVKDKFYSATWDDVEKVLRLVEQQAFFYENNGKDEKAEYIRNEIYPMIRGYINTLKLAQYSACDFFDPEFTIDTGIICNLGRSLVEFKGLTERKNEPLTPTHERNYGRHNSLMTQENVAWRLSCEYGDKILVEKRCLYNTASIEGQVIYKKTIQLKPDDEILDKESLQSQSIVPGQKG